MHGLLKTDPRTRSLNPPLQRCKVPAQEPPDSQLPRVPSLRASMQARRLTNTEIREGDLFVVQKALLM